MQLLSLIKAWKFYETLHTDIKFLGNANYNIKNYRYMNLIFSLKVKRIQFSE